MNATATSGSLQSATSAAAGLIGNFQALPNSGDRRICSAHCSGQATVAGQCPASPSSFGGGFSFLGSSFTGSESRQRLCSGSGRTGLEGLRKLPPLKGIPVAGLIRTRRISRPGQSNPATSLEDISMRQAGRYSIFPTKVSNSRLAYGYFLGPVYGYGGGFGNSSLLLFIVLGFVAVQAFQSLTTDRSERGYLVSRDKVSVLKLQVGLLGFARTLQDDLERIADRADTSTSRGLHYVLTETVLALLRQPDMCILGTSSSDVKRSIDAGERRFNQLSLEERGKLDEETLVNVDGNRKRLQDRGRGDGFSNEYIVVTLLVAAEGDYNLPAIYDNNDLKDALKKLGSIPADNIQGVEVLWTPQDKSDSLTERELLRNYPLLKSL